MSFWSVDSPSTSLSYLAVLIGGALGALSRSLIVSFLEPAHSRAHIHTLSLSSFLSHIDLPILLVNVLGSFLAGLSVSLLSLSSSQSFLLYQNLLLTGYFGAFTTFSALSLETILLATKDEVVPVEAIEEENEEEKEMSEETCFPLGLFSFSSASPNMSLLSFRTRVVGLALMNLAVHNILCIGLVFFGLALPRGFSTSVSPTYFRLT